MDIAVCDNDTEILNNVKNLIVEHKPNTTVITFLSAEELFKSKAFFDIYFLDIKGISGMELARKIRERESVGQKSVIIFVTGYDEYMPEAFDVQAFHYLLKPVKVEKFKEVLEKAVNEIKTLKNRQEAYVLLKLSDKTKKVFLRDIFYAESAGKKVKIHTTEGVFEVAGKMEDFEKTLGDSFYRCHRCYLVNFEKISSYNQNEIETTNGDKILLAYKRYSAFLKAYLAYAKRGGIVNV